VESNRPSISTIFSRRILCGIESTIDIDCEISTGRSRWGWVFLERTWILNGIQFTTHFMEIFVVETKWFVGSTLNVILTRQTCGQRSSRTAESKRRALGNYFSERICYMFLISKCRGDWDLGLCTTSGLAFGESQRSGDFREKNVFWRRKNRILKVQMITSPPFRKQLRLADLTMAEYQVPSWFLTLLRIWLTSPCTNLITGVNSGSCKTYRNVDQSVISETSSKAMTTMLHLSDLILSHS